MSGVVERAKELRRFRPYPSYIETGISWLPALPAHWQASRLKNVARVRPSNVDKHTVHGEEPVRLCNYTDVYYNDRIQSDLDFMKASASNEEIRKFALAAGDVLITKDSETPDDIAVPAHVEEDLGNVLCGYHLAHIRPDPTHFVGSFLARGFVTDGVRDQFRVASNGITRFGLSLPSIANSVFPAPPLAEQRAIADFLDRETAKIDALVTKKERLIELLQEKRTALITHAVTKGLDPTVPMKPSGIEWLGEIPAHWEVIPWRFCCRITEGQVDPTADRWAEVTLIAPNHVESGTGRILATETAHDQGAISGKYRVPKGSLIYSKIRPALNKVCIAEEEWLCSADMYPVVPSSRIEARFLLYFILSTPFVQLMVDASMRVAMPKVNRNTLAAAPVLIPPKTEQQGIIEGLDGKTQQLDSLAGTIVQAIERLKEYRTALISAAVTGKIDVRNEVPAA